MNREQIRIALNHKLDIAWEAYRNGICGCSPAFIFNQAEKISSTLLAYQELRRGNYAADHLKYLLRFADPLEVVRNQWIDENNVAHEEEMTHVLRSLVDKQQAERCYPLDPTYLEPEAGSSPADEIDYPSPEPLPFYRICCYEQDNQFYETTLDTIDAVVDYVCERRNIYKEVKVYQAYDNGMNNCELAVANGQILWGEPTLLLTAQIRAQELDFWPKAATDPGYRRVTVGQLHQYYEDNREDILSSIMPVMPEYNEVAPILARKNNPALFMDNTPAVDMQETGCELDGHDQGQQMC